MTTLKIKGHCIVFDYSSWVNILKFEILLTYFEYYTEQEASFAPISFELQRNDNWTGNIQSFEISFQMPVANIARI